MDRELTSRRGDVGMLASVALAKLALHLVLSGRYPARLRARAARPARELGGCVALSHDHFEG